MREHLILRTPPTAEPLSLADAKAQARQSETFDDALITTLIAAARQFAETVTRRAFVAQRFTYLLDEFPRPGFNVGSANWYGPQWGINPGPLTVVAPDGSTGYEIWLPNPPLIAVESITYIDSATNLVTTLDPSLYLVVPSEKALIVPSFGNVWPQTQQQKAAVVITFTAGYAAPFTATATPTNTIAVPLGPSLNVGDTIRVSNQGGALPAPLVAMTDYFVQSVVSTGVYKLAATSGGAAITLSDAGSGVSFIGAVPEGILAWMKARIGTLYENREEVALLNRGKVELLPYVDNLLDPFRVLEF
jgi:hypothetical protein